jgi:hypothetical protein
MITSRVVPTILTLLGNSPGSKTTRQMQNGETSRTPEIGDQSTENRYAMEIAARWEREGGRTRRE